MYIADYQLYKPLTPALPSLSWTARNYVVTICLNNLQTQRKKTRGNIMLIVT